MRVNPDLNSGLLAALQRATQTESNVLGQLASGKKIQKPSDDPAGLAALVEVQSGSSNAEQYLSNIAAIRSQMQAADSSLNSAMLAIERALTLGVRGATGTLTDSDRESVASELDGLSDQLLEIANSSSQGVYLFAGTASTDKPFVQTGTAITYEGRDQSNDVAIGDGFWIRTNLSGTTVFGNDTNGLFASMKNMATALRTGGGITAAIDSLRAARDQVSTARVVYGNSLNQIDSSELMMNERKLQLAQQETDIAGVDLADAATQLSSAITSRNALLSTISKATGTSLFDYVK